MFDFFKRNRNLDQKTEHRLAMMQGQIIALHMVMKMMMDRMPAQEQRRLNELLKYSVGQGFGGKGEFLGPKVPPSLQRRYKRVFQRFID